MDITVYETLTLGVVSKWFSSIILQILKLQERYNREEFWSFKYSSRYENIRIHKCSHIIIIKNSECLIPKENGSQKQRVW